MIIEYPEYSDFPVISSKIVIELFKTNEIVDIENKIIDGNILIDQEVNGNGFDNNIVCSKIFIRNCLIRGKVNFSETTFCNNISFYSTCFLEPVNFEKACFKGETVFDNTIFVKHISFKMATFNKMVSFKNTYFKSHNANIRIANTDNLHQYLKERDRLYGKDIKSKKKSINREKVNKNKTYSMQFPGNVDFTNTTFHKNVTFSNAQFLVIGDFSEAKFNEEVNFNNTVFNNYGKFENVLFKGEANFTNAKFKDAGIFNGVISENDMVFINSKIDNYLLLEKSQFNGDILTFKDATFLNPYCQEEACRRARIKSEKSGRKEDADYHYYQEMEAKRKQQEWYKRYPEYLFVQMIFGYGVHPFRLILWIIGIVILFSGIYWFFGMLESDITYLDHLKYSFTMAIIPGYSEGNPIKPGYLPFLVSMVEAIIGIFIWGAFIATFARKYMR